jgi:hypothetical protein
MSSQLKAHYTEYRVDVFGCSFPCLPRRTEASRRRIVGAALASEMAIDELEKRRRCVDMAFLNPLIVYPI